MSAGNGNIIWTRNKLMTFTKAYGDAVERKQGQFIFEENVFLTSYAKYLIEYLLSKFETLEDGDG